MNRGRGGVLHSSWNWELISDKPLDWWLPRLERIKKAFPDRVLIASIMAGSGSDKELDHWRTLAHACQDAGADGLELNLSCPHMDRDDMGSNIGKDQALCSFVTQVVKEVARVPVWAKLTPATSDIVVEAGAVFRGGGDAVVSSNTFPSLPLIDPETLEFEMNVDGLRLERRPGRPGHPAAVAGEDVADDARVPREELLRHRRHLRLRPRAELLPARLRHGAGVHRGDARPRRRPERHPAAARGLARVPREERRPRLERLDDFRGLRRDRVVSHSQIRRPESPTTGRLRAGGYAERSTAGSRSVTDQE